MTKNKGGRPRGAGSLFFDSNSIYDIDQFHEQFVELGDITGYEAALSLLTHVPKSQRWSTWNVCLGLKKFSDRVELMVQEIQAKQRAAAIKKLVESDSDAANKFIATSAYEEKQTKAKRSKAAKDAAKEAADTKEDMARIEEALGSIMESS